MQRSAALGAEAWGSSFQQLISSIYFGWSLYTAREERLLPVNEPAVGQKVKQIIR